jgi:hypothetical protein
VCQTELQNSSFKVLVDFKAPATGSGIAYIFTLKEYARIMQLRSLTHGTFSHGMFTKLLATNL